MTPYYQFISTVGFFIISAFTGYFLLPRLFSRDRIKNFLCFLGVIFFFILIFLFLSKSEPYLIFITAVLAGFSDMLDGSLARNNNRITKLGVVLDVFRDIFL